MGTLLGAHRPFSKSYTPSVAIPGANEGGDELHRLLPEESLIDKIIRNGAIKHLGQDAGPLNGMLPTPNSGLLLTPNSGMLHKPSNGLLPLIPSDTGRGLLPPDPLSAVASAFRPLRANPGFRAGQVLTSVPNADQEFQLGHAQPPLVSAQRHYRPSPQYYCHMCQTDLPYVDPGMFCPYCSCDFIEESVTAERSDNMAKHLQQGNANMDSFTRPQQTANYAGYCQPAAFDGAAAMPGKVSYNDDYASTIWLTKTTTSKDKEWDYTPVDETEVASLADVAFVRPGHAGHAFLSGEQKLDRLTHKNQYL